MDERTEGGPTARRVKMSAADREALARLIVSHKLQDFAASAAKIYRTMARHAAEFRERTGIEQQAHEALCTVIATDLEELVEVLDQAEAFLDGSTSVEEGSEWTSGARSADDRDLRPLVP